METIWIPFVVAALIAFAATPFVIKIAPKKRGYSLRFVS